MLEYEQRQALYAFLKVPNLPKMHWSNSSAWQMANSMYNQIKEAIKKQIVDAHFVALTCDEVTTIDNESLICIHAYVVQNYIRVCKLPIRHLELIVFFFSKFGNLNHKYIQKALKRV